MIDFKNAKSISRRVTKHTVEEGDFYTCSITALEKEDVYNKNESKPEEVLMVEVLKLILCDEDGKLLDLSLEDLKNLPDALFQDIVSAAMGNVLGEKKS